jgi:hypothetical protein
MVPGETLRGFGDRFFDKMAWNLDETLLVIYDGASLFQKFESVLFSNYHSRALQDFESCGVDIVDFSVTEDVQTISFGEGIHGDCLLTFREIVLQGLTSNITDTDATFPRF